jgi:hypothetical protein
MKARKSVFSLVITLALTVLSSFIASSVHAKVTGQCSNCHTMHNSQGGTPMATYGNTGGVVQPMLLRGTCLGCHGQGTGENIINIGGSEIPQIYHTNTTDLAGGNFVHLSSSDANGHNVVDFGNDDVDLDGPPGGIIQSFHYDGHTRWTVVEDTNLTCAGENGCHGYRVPGGGSGIPAIKGAHHGNVDGVCDTADSVANSYRFLFGVKGLENPVDKWQNKGAMSHNEYYGATTPPVLGCSGAAEMSCHVTGGVGSPNNTISGFCATCHGNFHTLQSARSDGIGSDATGPFQRHPTDIVLTPSGEYLGYSAYSVEAPVARWTVPGSVSGGVAAGTDVVMCLSCHAPHATQYPDILRWDYTTMNAGGGGSGGCFTCHTKKDGS